MRPPIRLNRYGIGAIIALFVALFFMNYQKFDIASWLPFAPPMDRLSTSNIFTVPIMISLCFSLRNSLEIKAAGPNPVSTSIVLTLAAVLLGILIFFP